MALPCTAAIETIPNAKNPQDGRRQGERRPTHNLLAANIALMHPCKCPATRSYLHHSVTCAGWLCGPVRDLPGGATGVRAGMWHVLCACVCPYCVCPFRLWVDCFPRGCLFRASSYCACAVVGCACGWLVCLPGRLALHATWHWWYVCARHGVCFVGCRWLEVVIGVVVVCCVCGCCTVLARVADHHLLAHACSAFKSVSHWPVCTWTRACTVGRKGARVLAHPPTARCAWSMPWPLAP